jgi:hypothetical protein
MLNYLNYDYFTGIFSKYSALVCKMCIKKQQNALNYTDVFL